MAEQGRLQGFCDGSRRVADGSEGLWHHAQAGIKALDRPRPTP